MSEKIKIATQGRVTKRFTYAISGFSQHKRLRDIYLHVTGDSWFFECAGRAAVGEHQLNHKKNERFVRKSGGGRYSTCTPTQRPIHHSPLSKLKRVFIPT